MRNILQDLAFSARTLRKRPGFFFLAMLTVALGIGVNTSIFAVVHDVLWKPLPYADADRLVMLYESSPSGDLNCSYPNSVDWRARSRGFEDIALFRGFPSVTLRLPQATEMAAGGFADPNLFTLFKIQPALGRIFTNSEDQPGVEPIAVISDRAWKRFFGRDPGVVGRRVRVRIAVENASAESITIAGVLPPGFRLGNIDVWLPLKRFWGPIDADRGNHWFAGFGKLKPGVTLEHARADLDSVSRALEQQFPASNTKVRATGVYFVEAMTGSVRTPLLLLLGAVTFVWLIACGNVMHLMLTRTLGRDREIAVRVALGASYPRLAQLLLAEGFWVAAIGGALGGLLAMWGIQWAVAYQPGILPRASGIHFGGESAGYVAGMTALTFFALGLAPLWRAFSSNLGSRLHAAGRGGMDRGKQRLGWLMIAGELALASMLLAGAGLMIQTLRNLGHVSLGYQPEHVMAVNLSLPIYKFEQNGKLNEAALAEFSQRIRDQAKSLPGFVSASMVASFEIGGNGMTPPVTIPGRTNPATPPMVPTTAVTPGFFETLRIPLRAGRLFNEKSAELNEVIVNEEFVRRFFPHENPLGRKIDQGKSFEIVGVAGNTRLQGPLTATVPEIYWAGDGIWDGPTLLVRIAGHPESVAAALRNRLTRLEPDMRVGAVELLSETEAGRTAMQRFTRALLLVFSALAMILASLGIYGVASYGVMQRTHEIGVRIALGASRNNVIGLILGQALAAAAGGAVIGVTGGLILTRFIKSQLYGVHSSEPWIYGCVMVCIALVVLAASALPVVRAARVDPAISLRQD